MKVIPNFSHYKVSRSGKIYSIRTKKFLVPYIFKGYYRVAVEEDISRIRKARKVARLVAITYIPNPQNKPEVNHKDRNKLNDRLNNLEWNTRKENMDHYVKTGVCQRKNRNRKLSKRDVLNIRKNPKKLKNIQLAEIYDVSSVYISQIKTGVKYKLG